MTCFIFFDIANYIDDTTAYNADKNIEFVVNNLEHLSSILIKWLKDNWRQILSKYHLLVSGNVRTTAKIDNNYIESEKGQVLLGITIGSNLTFENLLIIFIKEQVKKLNALARVASYMNMQKRRVIMKSCVTYQFGYCLSIWMFRSGRLNNKINSIHEESLRITYQYHISTFQELLNKGNSVPIHHKKSQL